MAQQLQARGGYLAVDNASGATITIPTACSRITVAAFGCLLHYRTGAATLAGTDVEVGATGCDAGVPNGAIKEDIIPDIDDAKLALRARSGATGYALVFFETDRVGLR